jgi:hypothetical protein
MIGMPDDNEYPDEGCDVNPIDWDKENYDGQGKSIRQEVEGQQVVAALVVVAMSAFLFLGLLLLVWWLA